MASTDKEKSGEPRGLLARIKSMFKRGEVPEKTEMIISGVESVHELRRALDDEITENEVYAGQVERELEKIGDQIEDKKALIKAGESNERAKINHLRAIKRLKQRADSYERRLKILQDNIDLHLAVLHRIDEMEAMEMKAIQREQIEEIAVDYDERSEAHRELVNVVRSAEIEPDYEDLLEKKELAELEAEILAEAAAEAEAEVAATSKEPAVKEPVAKEPVVKDPVVKEPVVKEPVVREPVEEAARRPSLESLLEREENRGEEVVERQLEME